jgi:protein phosphatase
VPAAITDTGCERELNEDRYAVVECASGLAWIVCDGMGGAKGGELAAQLVIDAIRSELESLPKTPVAVAAQRCLVAANRVICLRRQNPAFSEMGTTAVVVLFDGVEVAIVHAGDSRAYLVRDAAIQQLTKDHTYVQDLVDQGKISQEEAMSHPQAHVLTRCVGADLNLPIDLGKFWIWDVEENSPVDYMVLCSDGLYSLITDGEIASIISENTPQRACVQLVELARARGGYDNITVAIVPLDGQLRSERVVAVNSKSSGSPSPGALESGKRFNRGWLMMILGMLSMGLVFALLVVMGLVN